MPLYEFECSKCGHRFDRVLTLSEVETVKVTCPQCRSAKVKKLMSAGTIKTGWDGYAGKVQ
ncbi:MAG: zinc ribbon domain-containing protein [bacterium]|nr:MAG: zinc ribbon domain-containing protein [bacterium]